MLYIRFTTTMDLADRLNCHHRASAHLGGGCSRSYGDTMKQSKISDKRWTKGKVE